MPICNHCTSAVSVDAAVCPFCRTPMPGATGSGAAKPGATSGAFRDFETFPSGPGPADAPPMEPFEPGSWTPFTSEPAGDGGAYAAQPFGTGSPPPPPTMTSRVDAFHDSLVPYLGDPEASRGLGRLVQVCAAGLVLYNVLRAVLWGSLSSMTRGLLNGTGTASGEQIVSLGKLIDTVNIAFWPSLILMLVVDVVWRYKRRPKKLLQARGEAFVEATLTRAVPLWARLLMAFSAAVAAVTGIASTPTSRLRPSDVPGYATSRAVSCALWAVTWALFIAVVWFSERHLDRRVAKAADPELAAYAVPYVQPEKNSSTIGTPAGAGWVFRTAGLVIALMIAILVVIGAAAGLPSGKDTVALLAFLVGGLAVVGLVIWAFARRVQRGRTASAQAVT